MRQGSLRLRLRAPSAAPDQAADPQARRPEESSDDGRARASGARSSAKPPGKRRWTSPAASSTQLRDTHGAKSLAGFGSAKGSNEEAYLFQKLVRTGFGSNNVDHCTRLCHASSVAALLEGVGSGAVSNQVNDVEHAGPDLRHRLQPDGQPPGGRHLDEERRQARREDRAGRPAPSPTSASTPGAPCSSSADTDVAMLNALIHTVIDEGLVDEAFIRERASNFEALKENVQGLQPRSHGADLRHPGRDAARGGARLRHRQGRDGAVGHGHQPARARHRQRALPDRAGDASPARSASPARGLHPLRGQNNVQGASDAGLIPMMFPNYQRVDNAGAHAWFEKFWDMPLDAKPGYTVVEIMHKALADDSDPHKIRGMYIMGENPAMSDPDLNHARHALGALEHLVVQDIFMTETAWLADVVLPASAWPEKTGTVTNTDRMVQLGKRALNPPGDARPDLWIIQQIAHAHGPALELRRRGVRRRRGLRGDAPGHARGHRRHHLGARCSASRA